MLDVDGRLIVIPIPRGDDGLWTLGEGGGESIPLGITRSHRCICDDGMLHIPDWALAILNGIRYAWAIGIRIDHASQVMDQERACPVCHGTARQPVRTNRTFRMAREHRRTIGQAIPASKYKR